MTGKYALLLSGLSVFRLPATKGDRKVQHTLQMVLGQTQKLMKSQTDTNTAPNPRKIQEVGKPVLGVVEGLDGQRKHRRKIQQVFALMASRTLGNQMVASSGIWNAK